MARNTPIVAIHDRGMWSVAEFAAYIGVSETWVRDATTWDTETEGFVALPHGVQVPIHRNTNGWAVIYRRYYDEAVARGLRTVPHWNGFRAVNEHDNDFSP